MHVSSKSNDAQQQYTYQAYKIMKAWQCRRKPCNVQS